MITSVIVNLLRGDAFITNRISEYASYPAIFADVVPEKALFPNITVRVMQAGTREAIKIFNIYIDYWGHHQINASREAAKVVCNRIESILDGYLHAGAETERYSDIRFRLLNGYCATADEYDGIHYNLFFSARACRKEWIDNVALTTTVVPTTTYTPTTTVVHTTTASPTTTSD
jgi:hypothetical protein